MLAISIYAHLCEYNMEFIVMIRCKLKSGFNSLTSMVRTRKEGLIIMRHFPNVHIPVRKVKWQAGASSKLLQRALC